MADKLKNNSGSDITLSDIGELTIVNGGERLIDPIDALRYARSSDLETEINAGNIEVESNAVTLSAAEGLFFIQKLALGRFTPFSATGFTATNEREAIIEAKAFKTYLPEYDFAESDGSSSTTSTTYQEKLAFTTESLVGGEYHIQYSAEIRNSSEESGALAECLVDDTNQIAEHGASYSEDQPHEFYAFSGIKKLTLSAGTHDIDINFKEVSGGTAEIRRARIEIWRVED